MKSNRAVLYVDESGDEGISSDRQSRFFVLGAVFVRKENQELCIERLNKIEEEIKQEIHFSELKHDKKKYVARCISRLPVMCFSILSNKNGLDRGGYRNQIQGQRGFFYNKNVHYLLEQVGRFCEERDIIVDEIIFEKSGNKNYNQLRSYLKTISNKPLHKNAEFLRRIDPATIRAEDKKACPLLKFADAASSSVYQACTENKYKMTETGYLEELSKRFVANPNGAIEGYGLKIVPSSGINDFPVDLKTKELLVQLKGVASEPKTADTVTKNQRGV